MSEIAITHCPICNSTNLRRKWSVKDESISKETFRLSQCESCSFLFTNPQPSSQDLWKYYQSEDYVSHSKSTKGFINYWYRKIQKLNLSLKFKAIKSYVPRGTWLDYGAGAGDFVKYIKSKGIKIDGLEPSETARKTAASHSICLDDPSAIQHIPNNSIACITLWHVLEHISDFYNILQKLTALLKPDGILVIAVPNYLSLDGQKYAENWAALDVPRHLWHFTQHDIAHIAESLNLDLVKTSGMVFDSFYVSLLSEKYLHGSKMNGLFNGLQSNLSAWKNKTPYSSQIYILKKKAL